jgi:GR25 family glycosyltransferase involved in LPS biosynthesis
MKPSKAYILYHENETSKEYAKTCADSCERLGMEYEYFLGFSNIGANDAWNSIGLKRRIERRNNSESAQLCSAGHAAIWKKIYDNKECAIVFEHDAILLHRIDINIPNQGIVVLGYKVKDPQKYDHERAGHPIKVELIKGHEGAHAYAITHETAKMMLDEIERDGVWSAVDNMFFLRGRRTKVPIFLMNPTPAIGWLRKSTIWKESSTRNYDFVPSFQANYKK